MEKEKKGIIPKAGRYPLFLLGLVILVGGAFAGPMLSFSATTDFAVGALGFLCLLLSIAIP